MKRGLLLTGGLVTAFLVSFSASAYFMMNAKDLMFAKDKQEISALMEQLESKETEIADLKEQVERYQTLYEAAAAAKPEVIEVTVRPTATQTPSVSSKPTTAQTAGTTVKPTKTAQPTATAPAKTSTPAKTSGSTTQPLAPDESNTSAHE